MAIDKIDNIDKIIIGALSMVKIVNWKGGYNEGQICYVCFAFKFFIRSLNMGDTSL